MWSYLQLATNVTIATAIQCLQSIAPRSAHQLLIPPCLCGENCFVQGTCDFHGSFSCTPCLLQGWLSCAKLKPRINAHGFETSCHETSIETRYTHVYIYIYLNWIYIYIYIICIDIYSRRMLINILQKLGLSNNSILALLMTKQIIRVRLVSSSW